MVQRYGAGIAGGSERHCRELALRLAASHDVTILTTCAADYVTWDNEFPVRGTGRRPVHDLGQRHANGPNQPRSGP